jgi:hypothetical protein
MTLSLRLSFLATATCLACSAPAYADGTGDFQWQKKLDAAARLEIHDMNGRIKAEPTDDDTLRVVAVKTGRREDLARVNVVVREQGDRVIVCALWPGQSTCESDGHAKNDVDVRVDFVVKVPSKVTRVTAETMNGAIVATTLRGDAELRTMNGSIEVASSGAIDAKTMNGSIKVSLPRDTNADVEASTVRGSISNGFGADPKPEIPGIPIHANFRIGAGGKKIALETLNGDVVLRRGA